MKLMRLNVSIALIIMMIFSIALVSADITQINIKTVPNYDVQVTPYLDQGGFNALERYRIISDEYGDVNIDFDTGSPIFNVVVFVKNDGITMFEKRIFDHKNAEPINLELIPSWFEAIPTPEKESELIDLNSSVDENINDSEEDLDQVLEESEEVIEEESGSEEKQVALTGFAILGSGGTLSKYKYYAIGIVVLILIIVAFFLFRKYHHSTPKSESVPKEESDKSDKPEASSSDEKPGSSFQRIKDAEKKILEAQKEINELKGVEKMKFAEQKLKRDQDALERLRKASDQ